jgi:hypothetical protein
MTDELASVGKDARALMEQQLRSITLLLDDLHVAASPAASATQSSLLTDEDIVEGILFCACGRVTRPTVTSVQDVNDEIIRTLHSARLVCRVWSAAGAKPLLAATLDKQLCKFKLAMDFFGKKRAAHMVRVKPGSFSAGLALADVEAFQWLSSGYENGFNSVLADDPGLDGVGPCAATIKYIGAQRDERPWHDCVGGPHRRRCRRLHGSRFERTS